MTRRELNEIFTAKVMEYLEVGYIFHTESTYGSDGNANVDLVKGNQFVRVYLKRDVTSYMHKMILTVGTKTLNCKHDNTLLWTSGLKTVYEEIYYEVSKDRWYVTEEEVKRINDIRRSRAHYTNHQGYYVFSEKAHTLILPLVNRQKGCKTKKAEDISKVVKIFYRGDVYPTYHVSFKNGGHILLKPRR